MEKSRPYVILSAAISIDGKIATRTGRSNLSSKKDLVRVHTLRKSVDAILVGKNTVNVDNPSLTVRHVKGKNPIRIILDPNGSLSLKSKVIRTAKKTPTILVVSENTKNMEKFVAKGAQVIRCGKKKINIKKLMQILDKRDIKRIVVEGGGTTNWYFFKEKLVDEIIITVTPYVLGGNTAISLVEGIGFENVSNSFKLKKIKKIQNELVLHYVS
ncbi:Diaminohydroxyphosphoribosylaminopyrimidine deaminase [Candidatus Nitrosotalea sp. FS]|uniref:2,5-diamino-6-(ribosylamino)-4(3H)-pyrimidinone 5'-phosphate reductase n=1 Tax=Candidatus Nitrosotalea sp. FS TaxID=2341021 RepID=UPI00140E184D|nr:2,5-diamino-6-(ribosylamino)-4(3H)-pyrimidinone 5'-phosphate reductase [Candidatus Nitrosotalea sp. FS]NHH96992.1 Diaminohydroxyphosphoribosylaminopyrimidine deaminase [Candidatus Nitrosotalea sp. FS]